jgi:surface protein
MEVDTANTGVSNSDQFQFTGAEGDYDVVAKQNDIVVATFNDLSNQETITLPSSGVYDLEVIPKEVNGFNRIAFATGGDRLKMLDIKQWGTIVWSSFNSAFWSCQNMLVTATDVPNLSNVNRMSNMFRSASLANPNTSNWNTISVTDMSRLFQGASSANPDVSNWDVSNVTTMQSMFFIASIATPDVRNWDVSSVTNMSSMFRAAILSNPDARDWNVSSVTNMIDIFRTTNLSIENLTAIYENWSQLNLQQNVEFGAGTIKYNFSGQEGRDILINTYNWSISDGGENLFLNQFPNASLGLSLDKLNKNYTSSAIKVRRSSDNTELDIGFVNNELDTASLLDFVGSGDGFVSIWYGQSFNGFNAFQTLAANQPKIVSNGSLILDNGNPAIEFDGNSFLSVGSIGDFNFLHDGTESTVISVLKFIYDENTYSENMPIYASQQNTSSNTGILLANDNRFNIGRNNNKLSMIARGVSGVQNITNFEDVGNIFSPNLNYLLFNEINASNLTLEDRLLTYLNGNLTTKGNVNDNTPSNGNSSELLTIGSFGTSSQGKFKGKMQNFIVYPTNQSANRLEIQNIINQRYSIY